MFTATCQEYSLNIVNGISEDVPLMLSQGTANKFWNKMPASNLLIVNKGEFKNISFGEYVDDDATMTLFLTMPYEVTDTDVRYKSVLCGIFDFHGQQDGIINVGYQNALAEDIASRAKIEPGQVGVVVNQKTTPIHYLTFSLLGHYTSPTDNYIFNIVGDRSSNLFSSVGGFYSVNNTSDFSCPRNNNLTNCLKDHVPKYDDIRPIKPEVPEVIPALPIQ